MSVGTKKRRIDTVLTTFVSAMKDLREEEFERKERLRKEKEAKTEALNLERQKEARRMHEERMSVQKDMVHILRQLVNKD
ncbi:hypothetical protein NQ314_004974 [Rhamnusium bicolor]|uniref:Pinin/SDK/MemA protein domain-containing protein n=1 Tax=Rhamnusium bicolor TaxID=1586634 RepID=A0AAV8ZHN7_9CUCU|nr:hypothetical protein NQ314_004974 [Rhamnusium bicolor]